MVQVRKAFPQQHDGTLDFDIWVSQLYGFKSAESIARFKKACAMAAAAQTQAGLDQYEDQGCFDAGLEMVAILNELHLDDESLIAAVIYRSVRQSLVDIEQVEQLLGSGVAILVRDVQRMAAISQLRYDKKPVLGQGQAQVENIRKMLISMVDDVRVGLIKLAERTHAIRAVKDQPRERQCKVAQEIFDIYVPLAHRLGIGQIKWELEDLSFRYLQPDAYSAIAKQLDGRRIDRQAYIDRAVDIVEEKLRDTGIEAAVNGRAKHIYSIYRKMQRKGVSFDQLYDIHAIRILVKELKDCYACLGVIHTLWRNIPNEFDDYIASPKPNGYRSLHTAVVGPESKVLEVQIRTQDMHEEAELGVCAHWLYKGTDTRSKSSSYEDKVEWLRQVLEWHEESGGDSEIVEVASELGRDFDNDRIYVFTPEGHVVDITQGSTPVDFAYHVHTEVGHKCRGAKVNGRIVPLNTVLENGQQVEILTGKDAVPNRDWLRENLGYLNSGSARAKVRAWFKKQAREENIAAGSQLLSKELKRLSMTSVDYKVLAEHLKQSSVENMYAALGAGDLSTTRVLRAAEDLFGKYTTDAQAPLFPSRISSTRKKNAVTVSGVGNLLTANAKCCKPLPGDDIVGYVTIQRGVTIHRKDCRDFLQAQAQQPERVIAVGWDVSVNDGMYPVDIEIEAYDRTGLLRDVTALLADMRINVNNINTTSDKLNNAAHLYLSVETRDVDQLVNVLGRLSNIPNIINAARVR